MLIPEKFLEQRKLFLWGAVDDASAKDIVENFFYLETSEPGKEITFYINTPGGSITAGMAVYDTIRLITISSQSGRYRNGCIDGLYFTAGCRTKG
jgi:ATP-dependent Clp protease protease subunit